MKTQFIHLLRICLFPLSHCRRLLLDASDLCSGCDPIDCLGYLETGAPVRYRRPSVSSPADRRHPGWVSWQHG